MTKSIKYSSYFLILLIIAKLIYIFLESNYNHDILRIFTDFNTTEDTLKAIEKQGHTLSSVGLALLVLPFAYLFIKRYLKNESKVFISSMVIFSCLIYIFYNMLTTIMDEIIARNSDKRYEAYYSSMFKYGILSKNFGYEAFIQKDVNFEEDVASSVLLSNIFLLSFVDESLIERVKDQAKLPMVDLAIERSDKKDEYENSRKKFIKLAEDIKNAWNKYNDGKLEVNRAFDPYKDKNFLGNEYEKFIRQMNQKYDSYIKAKIDFVKKRDKEYQNINKHYSDLKRYFQYKGNNKAEKQYSDKMYESFGKYISSNRWCEKSICPSKNSIKAVIDEEMSFDWNKKVGLPVTLQNQKEFLKYPKILQSVIAEFRKNGLNVSDNFNYSFEHFKNAYQEKIQVEYMNAQNKIKQEFETKINEKDIPLNLNWEQFARLFEDDLSKEFNSEVYGKKAIDLIISGELNNFYKELYKPMVYDNKVKEYFPDKEDFETNTTQQERGNSSIKMLYIPPFALFMSLFAGILNILSIFLLIAFIPLENRNIRYLKLIKSSSKFLLLAVILSFVYNQGDKKGYITNNEVLKQIDFKEYPKVGYYVKSLNSIIYLEELNESFYK